MKLGFISSSGGHWEELMCLKELAEEYDAFYVTEAGGQSEMLSLEHLYVVPQINRKERHFLIHFIRLWLESKRIIEAENPDVIITTGALMAFPFCMIAKAKRKNVIYIESFARVTDSSLTGRLVYPFADLFLVQWESMLKVYPKAIYCGSLF